MAPWPKTYRFLVDYDDAAVDEALVAAARQLDGPYLRYAIEVLLRRAEGPGLLAVVENFHRLPSDLKSLVLAAEPALASPMRTAIRNMQLQTRVNCLEMASQIGAESLAYLFDFGLMDTQARVRESAALMMRQMARRLVADHPLLRMGPKMPHIPAATPAAGPADPEAAARLALRRHYLFEALLSGVQRHETHLRSEILEACLWFEPYLGSKLWDLLSHSRARLNRLAGDLIMTSDQPQAACFLMQAMASPDLRPAALKVVTGRRDAHWFQGILRGAEIWHPWPRVRKAWNFIKEISYLETVPDEAWPSLGRSFALPLLVGASNLPGERKADVMGRLWRSGSGDCRRQIVLEAARGRDWGLDLLRTVLAESHDPQEVRMAAYQLLELEHEGLAGDLAKRLSSLGDPAMGQLANLAADEIFWRLWTRFDSMPEERRVAALGIIRNFGSYLRVQLRVNLAAASSSARVRSVRMVGMLGMVDDLWRDVLAVTQDPNSRVRSAAVRLLGRSNRPEMRNQLLAALDDKDGRVQANAIEAIDEAAWGDRVSLIVPKLHSENNRVRANAARAMAHAGNRDATEAICAMLQDSRVEYRLTAIWTIRTIGSRAWDEKLQELAEHDPAAAVRRFARSAYRHLHGAGSSSQTGQASQTAPVHREDPADSTPAGEGSRAAGSAPAGRTAVPAPGGKEPAGVSATSPVSTPLAPHEEKIR